MRLFSKSHRVSTRFIKKKIEILLNFTIPFWKSIIQLSNWYTCHTILEMPYCQEKFSKQN